MNKMAGIAGTLESAKINPDGMRKGGRSMFRKTQMAGGLAGMVTGMVVVTGIAVLLRLHLGMGF
jgi:hypothetical protein